MTITGQQVKEARTQLSWSRPQLAARVGRSIETIVLFENGDRQLSFFDASMIPGTLESAGVIFVEENGEGPGVTQRKGE